MKKLFAQLDGVILIEGFSVTDSRGHFSRLYCNEELRDILGQREVKQINQSVTCHKGSIRGFHFQYPPHAEMKFVRCLGGRVYDVVVDLRRGSSTFLKHYAIELSGRDNQMVVVPEGCAHGFQVLEENSEMLYLHTESYHPEVEGRIRYNDPILNISWPLPVSDITESDRDAPLITKSFKGIEL